MLSTPIDVQNINKSFKDQQVLKNVSIRIHTGEIYGLVGLNGIGKTTLIKIILDLLGQDNGLVQIFGVSNSNIQAKKNLIYLPEKFMPSSFLKGHEFLELSCGYYGKEYNIQEAKEICRGLHFDSKVLSQKISSYSKGMAQKLGLVSIFLAKAPLLILDEPMSGLDPNARIYLKEMLKEYRAQGNSIFFTSHILADIEEICDRIGVLNDGGITYEGTVSEFMRKFEETCLEKAFLNAIAEGYNV